MASALTLIELVEPLGADHALVVVSLILTVRAKP